jgi:hypothetical protein
LDTCIGDTELELAYTLSGGAPVIKSYQAGTTMSTAGVPVIGSAADAATDIGEVEPCTTAAAVGLVGLSLDTTGTVAATGAATADIMVNVVINPDGVYRAKLSGGTTADTALAAQTTTGASADGSVATGCTTYDNSVCWGYTGANIGEYRITDDTAGSFAIAMPRAIASGDQFLAATSHPCASGNASSAFFDLCTTLDQIVAITEDTDNDNFIVVDAELRASNDSGTTNSFYHIIGNAHLFASCGVS